MEQSFYISKSCHIEQQCIQIDAEPVFTAAELDFSAFAKLAFKHSGVAYPKFYKMDALSKLAFLAAEYLLQEEDSTGMALLLANRSGSMDTDLIHQISIQDADNFYPSPATFVYTLANICAGEISIRHQLQTENAFFIAEDYDSFLMMNYANYLLLSGRASKVLCGWVEYRDENYKAVLYLVDHFGDKPHTVDEINKLFKIK